MEKPDISIIIPTYNRHTSLTLTLASLANQTGLDSHFEVLVIDDGSSDDTSEICKQAYPFILNYHYQENQGDAAARNLGAQWAVGSLLVFLDDDIQVEPGYLRAIQEVHQFIPKRIVAGACRQIGSFLGIQHQSSLSTVMPETNEILQFTQLCSNNFAIRPDDYWTVGGMQGLGFQGSDIWCDVDFAYRAHRQGFEFIQSHTARCDHHDHNLDDRRAHQQRWYKSTVQAAALFNKYPELVRLMPMFDDKTPIDLRRDSPKMIFLKTARACISSTPGLFILQAIVNLLEHSAHSKILLGLIYRLIGGAMIYRGYRRGLKGIKP